MWPAVGRVLRFLGWSALGAWLLFVALVLVLRYVVLPKVGDYQAEIEQAASRAIGQTVKIERIEARWQGLNPDLVLDGVQVIDRQGMPVFSLSRVDSVLSWQSLWRGRLSLALLAFEGPVLHVRRDVDGRISVAGVAAEGESDPAFAQWVLEQQHIRIRDATIVWDDRLRRAPPLVLEDLQFGLDNSGSLHRFGLSAAPPDALAARIDLRGEIRGDIGQALETLSGKLFVELDYADLAGWRPWVDYPVHLPQGRGALRIWGDLANGGGKLTADVALEALRIRLGPKLPELDLLSMRGRLQGRYQPGEWAVGGSRVELLTQQGIRVAPTDFQIEWRENARNAATTSATAGASFEGNASANFLDLAALSSLAAYLPLDAQSRALLQKHQAQGSVAELRASWGMAADTLQRYSLKAGFTRLGILPGGYFPGASGISGRVELTEKGGDLLLDAGTSSLSLPAVFPEPDIALDRLQAKVSWQAVAPGIQVKLEKFEFAGPDAAGSAQGSYRFTGDGPGEIDLVANVDRGNGRAVWRFMPHAVNADARAWLRRGIVAGHGYDGKLLLKGNLKDFPFRDPATGQFIVTAKAAGASIDYAPGWPLIEQADADLSFGVGMKLLSDKATIFGTRLSGVTVEIPDFESHEEMLHVRGTAQGPTGEFLRFIDQSPVAASIDRFTDGMKASGDGSLDLVLDIPLRHVLKTKLRGEYRFNNNQLELLSGLPPLTQVNGKLLLSEKTVAAENITGRVFGGPLKVQVKSNGDKVGVLASGQANMTEVSRHFGLPLTEHLTGSAAWKADIGIQRRNADFVIESDLVGVTSPLPAPLNKTASTPLALRVQRSAPDAQREEYRIALGRIAQGVIVRRQGNWERGVFALGDAEPRLPERGLAVRVATPRLDGDAWRKFVGEPPAGGDGKAADNGLALSLLTLKTPLLRLLGREFHQAESTLRPRDGGWEIALNTQEAVGDLYWQSAGAGWLEGHFKRLVARPAASLGDGASELLNALPGMSVTADNFSIGELALGRLELKARNDKGAWRLDSLSLQNPDGLLKGKASWLNVGQHQTGLDFELTTHDAGKLLARLGYGEAMRRGSAKLTGDLQWHGPPTTIHYPSLSGQLRVNAEKGQFNQMEPGVGKLLGLISLQSLPRRLTLDFRDIFTDGLAFDRIEGKLAVNKGIMRTSGPLRINGPAAQIEIQGETDLKSETQDLQVVVSPEIGNVAAVGIVLVNPVVGAATLLANTVMQNPLNRLFSYRYHVTGSWSDPQVDKDGVIPLSDNPKPEEEHKP